MIFILLLLPALLFAESPRVIPDSLNDCVLILNIEDTLCTRAGEETYAQDTDGDGQKAWQELLFVVDSIADARGEPMCPVCSLEIKYGNNSASYPQSIGLDATHIDVDTGFASPGYCTFPAATIYEIVGDADYLDPQLAECYRKAYTETGKWPKYVVTHALPRWIRPSGDRYNDDPRTTGSSLNTDSIVAKSVNDYIEIFLNDSMDTDAVANTLAMQNGWEGISSSSFAAAARNYKYRRGFVPGTTYLTNVKVSLNDTVRQRVIVTSLEGITDDAVCDLVRKAYRGMGTGWTADGAPNYWGVAQGINDSSALSGQSWTTWSLQLLATDKTAATFAKNIRSAFGANYLLWNGCVDSLFFPTDTLVASNGGSPDLRTVYFGYNGGRTLTGGAEAIMYWTAASYTSTAIPTDIVYQTIMPLADGAFAFSTESWNIYTWGPDTALRSGTADDQTLAMEYLDPNGLNATCFVGNATEVSSGSTAASRIYLADGMYTPNMNFAEVSEMLGNNYKGSNIAIGWPLLYWRPAMEATNESADFSGSCWELLAYSGTMPADGSGPAETDSINFYIEYDNNTVLDTTIDTSPGAAVTFNLGSKWRSVGISRATVSLIDDQGYYHSSEFISP